MVLVQNPSINPNLSSQSMHVGNFTVWSCLRNAADSSPQFSRLSTVSGSRNLLLSRTQRGEGLRVIGCTAHAPLPWWRCDRWWRQSQCPTLLTVGGPEHDSPLTIPDMCSASSSRVVVRGFKSCDISSCQVLDLQMPPRVRWFSDRLISGLVLVVGSRTTASCTTVQCS